METRTLNSIKLGNDLKDTRNSQGLSLRDLAYKIGVPSATLSRLENGSMPEVNTLISVLSFVGKPMDHYIEDMTYAQPISDQYRYNLHMEDILKRIDELNTAASKIKFEWIQK